MERHHFLSTRVYLPWATLAFPPLPGSSAPEPEAWFWESHVLVDANPFLWGPATVGLPKTIRCSGESNLAARGLSDMYL